MLFSHFQANVMEFFIKSFYVLYQGETEQQIAFPAQSSLICYRAVALTLFDKFLSKCKISKTSLASSSGW